MTEINDVPHYRQRQLEKTVIKTLLDSKRPVEYDTLIERSTKTPEEANVVASIIMSMLKQQHIALTPEGRIRPHKRKIQATS